MQRTYLKLESFFHISLFSLEINRQSQRRVYKVHQKLRLQIFLLFAPTEGVNFQDFNFDFIKLLMNNRLLDIGFTYTLYY